MFMIENYNVSGQAWASSALGGMFVIIVDTTAKDVLIFVAMFDQIRTITIHFVVQALL